MSTTESPARTAGRWLLLAIAAGLIALPARAQETQAQAEAAPAEELIEPAAREAVKRMVETLTGAQRLSYEYESSYDALQDDGELLEFGGSGSVTIRRPDRLRAELRHRDGRQLRMAWDGSQVIVLESSKNVYAATPRSGDLDSLIDFLREDVGMRLPTADLFKTDLREMLIANVVAARHVGNESLGEEEVDHVALRLRTGIDVQLWIRSGEHALPARLVMNFATADGRPSFRAEFREWDLDPSVRNSRFELDAPKGAKRVEFMIPRKSAAAAAVEEGAQ